METRQEHSVPTRNPQNRPYGSRKVPVRLWMICAILICAAFGVPTWSRYRTGIESNGQTVIARLAGNSDFNVSLTTLPTQPGETADMKITVTNYEGSGICETALQYTITPKTAGNLPLTFSLKADLPDGGTSIPSGRLTGNTASQKGSFEAGKKNSHVYTVTIAWPIQEGENTDDADYKDEIDYVQIGIRASQIDPKG